jgi:hypothetical protein
LTDGILILRYLFGFTDQPLVEHAGRATRTDATAIAAFLDGFIDDNVPPTVSIGQRASSAGQLHPLT